MFSSKSSIKKIMKIHFRTLQLVYGVFDEPYENLLIRSNDVSIHQKHLRYLAIEVYKSLKMFNPGFIWNFFRKNEVSYNLRRGDLVYLPPAKSTRYGINSLAFRGSLLWNNLPSHVKNSQTVEEFKIKVKNLRYIHCTCTVCRWRIECHLFSIYVVNNEFSWLIFFSFCLFRLTGSGVAWGWQNLLPSISWRFYATSEHMVGIY